MSILGTGIDIVECLRIAQMIERHGELFITRVYTDHEIEYCSAQGGHATLRRPLGCKRGGAESAWHGLAAGDRVARH